MSRPPATPLPSPTECRRLREAGSLSQAEAARKVGVTRETVRSWETGRTKPRGRRREAYAKLLADVEAETRARAATSDPAAPAAHSARAPADTAARTTAATPATTPATATATATAAAPAAAGVRRSGPSPSSTVTATPAPASAPAPNPARAASVGAGLTPAQAFDALYAFTAPALVRQTYLLTGRRALAQDAVERAFHQAWQRWPEVAVDRDPAGWVRAVAYEYAMAPWHRFRPRYRHPEAPPGSAVDRVLLDTLLGMPPSYRRTLLLHDGLGLGLPETAAETEASTPATASRLRHARQAVAARLPELAEPGALRGGLGRLAGNEKLLPPRVSLVRTGAERSTRFWTRAAIAFTVLILAATALTVQFAPRRYEPPQSPGETVGGVPPRMGPGPLSRREETLHDRLAQAPGRGPGRLHPLPG